MFGEIASAISILEKAKSWFTRRSHQAQDTPAVRLVQLFEAHDVHRNQIPRLLPALSLPSVADDTLLLNSLSSDVLAAAADMFAINTDWLEGASERIYLTHDFYKQPQKFISFLDNILETAEGQVRIALIAADTDQHECNALMIIEEEFGNLGDKPLHRYYLLNNWMYSYWKSRAYLTACVAYAWKRDVHVLGRIVPIEAIRKFRDGYSFLEYSDGSALPTLGEPWYPEDMAVRPEAFLAGIDEGKFGCVNGLRLWLELDEQNLMDTDLPYTGVRSQFEERLADYSNA